MSDTEFFSMPRTITYPPEARDCIVYVRPADVGLTFRVVMPDTTYDFVAIHDAFVVPCLDGCNAITVDYAARTITYGTAPDGAGESDVVRLLRDAAVVLRHNVGDVRLADAVDDAATRWEDKAIAGMVADVGPSGGG